MSIVPNFEGRITARALDKPGSELEFKKLPAVELAVLLTESYPSS